MNAQPIRAHDPAALSAALRDFPQDPGVRLVFLGDAEAPRTAVALQVANEVVAASGGRVALDVLDVATDPAPARALGVRRFPATAILGPEGDTGIRFYGSFEDFAVTGLVAALGLAAGVDPGLDANLRAELGELAAPIVLKVFVTPWDDVGLGLVRDAAALALASPLVRTEIWNALEFPAVLKARRIDQLPAALVEDRRIWAAARDRALVRAVVAACSTPAEEKRGVGP